MSATATVSKHFDRTHRQDVWTVLGSSSRQQCVFASWIYGGSARAAACAHDLRDAVNSGMEWSAAVAAAPVQ